MNRRIIRHDQPERLWVSVACFLVALAVAALLSIDDVEGTRPPRPDVESSR